MARKTLAERRSDALSELETAKARLAKLDNEAAERIGKIAIKSGLVNLEITDDRIREEFDNIVERIRKGIDHENRSPHQRIGQPTQRTASLPRSSQRAT